MGPTSRPHVQKMCFRTSGPCASDVGILYVFPTWAARFPHEQKLVGRILGTYMLPTLEHMLAGCGPHLSLFAGHVSDSEGWEGVSLLKREGSGQGRIHHWGCWGCIPPHQPKYNIFNIISYIMRMHCKVIYSCTFKFLKVNFQYNTCSDILYIS